MKKRPWQILLLAAMHALSPISAFFIGAWRMDLSPWAYSLFLRSEDSWTLVQHFALYPLGGLAIYSMKRWSYLVFLSVMAWSFWKHSQMGLPVIRLALVYSINLGLVTYFMIPAVRRAYFDSRIKWWESQTRYEFSVPAIVRGSDGQDHPIALLDFSQGGVFARWDSEKSAPEAQTRLRIEVALGGIFFVFPGTVMHRRVSQPQGLGVRFDFPSWRERLQAARFVFALRILGARKKSLSAASESRLHEILEGFVHFLRTGKGLVPLVPSSHREGVSKSRGSGEAA